MDENDQIRRSEGTKWSGNSYLKRELKTRSKKTCLENLASRHLKGEVQGSGERGYRLDEKNSLLMNRGEDKVLVWARGKQTGT